MKTSWQVATAAEAFAAAQLARCGWDVSVQYGANQPEYDLVAVDGDRVLKISVKGSKDGGWGLTQSFLEKADYHGAVDKWLEKHLKKTVFCLVQFKGVPVDALPRMYLATPREIGAWLKAAAAGRGDTILYEEHAWSQRAQAAGTTDRIPESWRFTEDRLNAIANEVQSGAPADGPRDVRSARRQSEHTSHPRSALNHRVRAAVILVQDAKVLLVKHVHPATGETWWIPPGGGLLPQDRSIIECAEREVFEETGLSVTVGKLVYLREFIEINPPVHHTELFFLAQDHAGELTLEHIKGKGPDEDFIRGLAWLGQPDMLDLTVYPEQLKDEFWDDLAAGFPEARYLGVHAD